MITTRVEIGGKNYLLCQSLRVAAMSVAISRKELKEEETVNEVVDMLKTLMDGGHKYALKMGIENPEPLTKDEILDYLGMDDFKRIIATIQAATLESSKRTIEVEPPKDSKKNGEPETALEN